MRKFLLSLAAAATVLAAGAISNRAEAMGPGPAGLNTAIKDVAVVDKVHCVPGWQHHYPTQWRRSNGCARYYRYGYATTYPYVYPHRIYPRRALRFHHLHRPHVRIHRRAHVHRFHRHRR